MARRWRVAAGLVALSALYVVGAYAYAQAQAVAQAAAPEVYRFLHEARLAYVATWGWVVGAPLVHVGLGGLAAWRRDAEAGLGVAASAFLQVGLAWAFGVLTLPGQP